MRPRLTLAVLTRDEEAMLPGLLASVQGAVDELLVVDSGSRDNTVALAKAAGATVIPITWTDDWSAARNAALPHVTSPYLLILDADERLGPGGAAALRTALAQGGFDCGLLPLHNASRLDASPAEILSGAARLGEPDLLPRLFRVSPSLRWQGAIHESPRDWLADKRFRALPQAPILHLGRVPSVEAERDKRNRNLRYLRLQVERAPDELWAYDYLAGELYQVGLTEEADAVATKGWALLKAAFARGDRSGRLLVLAGHLSQRAVARGELDAAAQIIAEARQMGGAHPNLDLLEGGLALNQACAGQAGAAARAEAAFRAAQAFAGGLFVEAAYPGATTWAAATGQGHAALLDGRPAEAEAAFRAALTHLPDHPEALLGLIDSLIQQTNLTAAARLLVPAIQRGHFGALRDPLLLAAELRGPGPAAGALLEKALLPGAVWALPPRRQRAESFQLRVLAANAPPRR